MAGWLVGQTFFLGHVESVFLKSEKIFISHLKIHRRIFILVGLRHVYYCIPGLTFFDFFNGILAGSGTGMI